MLSNRKFSIINGAICGLAFAPIFFLPSIFSLSFMCAQIVNAQSKKDAAIYGYLFGLGLYLSTIYWMAFGVSVYAEQFWWVIPFALLGLPAFIAIFYCLLSIFVWHFRKYILFHFIFCISWLFIEWLISWLFTGLPWTLIGYSLSVSNLLIQGSSIFGILGLSFAAVYIGSSLYSKKMRYARIIVSLFIIIAIIAYGFYRLEKNPTEFSDLKVRIVQPSIPQKAKWDPQTFWQNLDKQIEMSNQQGDPDIIVWSEAALTVPYYYKPVHNTLKSVFTKRGQILLSGGVNDNKMPGENYEIYSSLIALDSSGKLRFDYHKSHLVPFGEYIPFSKYLPLQKITYGTVDYTPGKREILYLNFLNLYVQPLVCYESIFSEEVRIMNSDADLIVNITNDAWYGNSSGPYQHFEISKMRSVENGLPMIRAGNNGISAIIDPVGRVIKRLDLNQIDIIDGFIPLKLLLPTIYSEYGQITVIAWVLAIFVLQLMVMFLKFLSFRLKNTCNIF
ncbi:MAG: apolipoprotein N-acyltransferase [Rickettsiaceae bacterium]|nr:apolipoprotein N-acyltransferase [Rickettsiaceae bacterium]